MTRERLNKNERREQIKAAARKVFLEKGFRNTVMDDLVQETGLSRGGLYHYYGSTKEILYDLMAEGNKAREHAIQQTIRSKNPLPSNQLIAELTVDKMLAENDYSKIYAMFLQEIKADDSLKKLYEKLKDESTQGILALFQQSGVEGEVEDRFISLLNLIIDLINSMILSCEVLGVRHDFIENRTVLVKMLAAALETEEK